MNLIKMLILIILTSIKLNSQNVDSLVNLIDIKIADINSSIDSYRITEKEIHGEAGEEAHLEGYFQKKELMKVKMIWFTTTHQFHTEYYLSGKNIILVKDTDYVYKNPVPLDSINNPSLQEHYINVFNDSMKVINEYYFDNFKIIRWIEKGKIIKDEHGIFDVIELQTAIQMKDFRKYLKKKGKIIKIKK
jgi:hypothetical protein